VSAASSEATSEQHATWVSRAIEELRAVQLWDGTFAFRDSSTAELWCVDRLQLADLGMRLTAGHPQAYRLWRTVMHMEPVRVTRYPAHDPDKPRKRGKKHLASTHMQIAVSKLAKMHDVAMVARALQCSTQTCVRIIGDLPVSLPILKWVEHHMPDAVAALGQSEVDW
jgi:hypothetical protein